MICKLVRSRSLERKRKMNFFKKKVMCIRIGERMVDIYTGIVVTYKT